MNVLVTGATGYIGGQLTKELVRRNESVDAFVRRPQTADELGKMGVGLIKGDLTDPASFQGKLGKYDIIYHLANVYDFWVPDRTSYYKVNVKGTRDLLHEAHKAGVGQIIYASTVEAIGPRKGELATEETVHCGYYPSDYSKSKYLGLCEVQRLASEGAPVITVMPGGVFGPEDHKIYGQYMLTFLNGKAPGMIYPDSVGCLCYIKDAVEGHILATKNGKVGEKYILMTSGCTARELYDTIADVAGIPRMKRVVPPAVVGMVSYYQAAQASLTKRPPQIPRGLVNIMKRGGVMVDNSKSIRELGIKYTPMEQAIRETVEWYRANRLAPPAPSPDSKPNGQGH